MQLLITLKKVFGVDICGYLAIAMTTEYIKKKKSF